MYRPFLILLVCQLLGELIARAAALPVPGPVLGLAFLLAALLARGGPDDSLAGVANGLLQHLSLLFVPAAVGLVITGGPRPATVTWAVPLVPPALAVMVCGPPLVPGAV